MSAVCCRTARSSLASSALPAVVGAVTGTTAIKSGQVITVDGNNGLVYLDGRSLD